MLLHRVKSANSNDNSDSYCLCGNISIDLTEESHSSKSSVSSFPHTSVKPMTVQNPISNTPTVSTEIPQQSLGRKEYLSVVQPYVVHV